MGTAIEWTGETWNPTTGCDRVSPGCDNCYAMKLAGRLKAMGQAKYQRDGDPRTSGPGFGLTLHPDALDIPLRRKKPTTWFVDSMSDLFHPEIPDEFIHRVWSKMAVTPRHTYQILTKRPQRAATFLSAAVDRWGSGSMCVLPNVWLGTSIESDRYVWRADHLRRTPAAVRFLSLEPLLGPVPSLDLTGIDWVIVGGESGPNARPMHPDWVRDIRDRCVEAGVSFFFKQWGAWVPYEPDPQPPFHASQLGDLIDGHLLPPTLTDHEPVNGWWWPTWGDDAMFRRVGKKAAGRELDGRTWDEMPEHAGAVA